MASRLRWWAAVALCSAASWAQTSASATAPDADRVFQATADVSAVEIDVTVFARGQALTGLSVEDFRIEVQGQEIPLDYAVSPVGGVGPPSESDAAPPRARYLLVFVDTKHLSSQPRRRALNALAERLERLLATTPDAQVMIVERAERVQMRLPFTDRGRNVRMVLEQMATEEVPTSEQETVRRGAALEVASELRRLSGSQRRSSRQAFDTDVGLTALRPVLENYAALENRSVGESLEGLYQFLNALAGLEGSKTVLFVSGGLALRPLSQTLSRIQRRLGNRSGNVGDTVEVSAFDSQEVRGTRQTESEELEEQSIGLDGFDLTATFSEVVTLANAHRVSIHPMRATGAADETGASAGDIESLSDLREGLEFLAQRTGGVVLDARASTDPEDDDLLVAESPYRLGFVPPVEMRSGVYPIEVSLRRSALRSRKLRRGAVDLRVAESFALRRSYDALAERVRGALSLDLLQNPFGVKLEVVEERPQSDGSVEVEFFLSFPLSRLSLLPAGESHTAAGEVLALAELGDFGLLAPQRMAIDLTLPTAEVEEARRGSFGSPFVLRLQPGPARVAVGVWDAVAGVGSFVGRDLEVGAAP
ncbi:MAG: hypothetical protein AAGA81_17225 [Acidobacteriota bacterium]